MTVTRTVLRFRLAAVSLGLVLLAFVQSPGKVAADTKLDLVVDPVGFLQRAIGLWDPQGYFGQLQNQAYGYLVPMGPFFVLGKLAHLEPWVVQRAWWALLLVVAFLGTYRVLVALRVGTPATRVLGALAYALAPRILTELGAISSESMPMAFAPWILLPLIQGAAGGSTRRAAARSGLAIVLAGGVNAVATLAVLPLPAWWLLTRERGPRRASLMRWWAVAVVTACAWWAIPLLVLGRYSPPFLDWIESAQISTSVTTLLDATRGTSHWLARIVGPDGAEWPAGWLLVTVPVLVLATTGLAALGLAGASRRDNPHRHFLVGAALIGLTLVTLGHLGPVTPPWAGAVRELLDGPLAPFRNVHKFDPTLRLAVAAGVAHLLAVVTPVRRWPSLRSVRVRQLTVLGLVSALALTAAPALLGGLASRPRDVVRPDYWASAADWLAKSSSGGRALVVPAAPFGTYYWGRTNDDVLQPLARSPWGVRDAQPLSSAGNIRVMDAVDRVLGAGKPSPGLADFLAESGIDALVVRNDLDWRRARATRPELVHEALDNSPGLARAIGFGPLRTADGREPNTFTDPLLTAYRSVEVYTVQRSLATVRSVALGDVLRVAGGPEAALALADRQLLGGRPMVLAGDDAALPAGVGRPVLSDTLRRREYGFGEVKDNVTPTLTADEEFRQRRPVHDYLTTDDPARLTVARLGGGVRAVRASSSGSDVDATLARGVDHAPWSALDGDPATAWTSGTFAGAGGQWWEVEFTSRRDLTGLRVAFAADAGTGPLPTKLRLTTERGSRVVPVSPDGAEQVLTPPAGPSRTLRLTVEEVAGGGAGVGVAIASVGVPGLVPTRTLALPTVAAEGPPIVVLDTPTGRHGACLVAGERPVCVPDASTPSEEPQGLDRTFRLATPGSYAISGQVLPVPGMPLDEMLRPSGGALVTGEAVGTDPRTSAQAVFDDDPATTWTARPGVARPAVTVVLPSRRTVTGLDIVTSRAAAAAMPRAVEVSAGDQRRTGTLDDSGRLRFAPLTGTTFRVTVLRTDFGATTDLRTGRPEFLPAGIGELRLYGAEDLVRAQPRSGPTGLPCGFGPQLEVDGRSLPTQVTGTVGDLVDGRPLSVRPCDGQTVQLGAGEHRVVLGRTDRLVGTSLTLRPPHADVPAGPGRTVSVQRWEPTARAVSVGAAVVPTLLIVPENANAGWRATLDGRELAPLRVDGWQQGWIMPAGSAGTVELRYAPVLPYRLGLAAGALALVALVALALVRSRAPLRPPPAGPATGVVARGAVLVLPTLLGGVVGAGATAVLLLLRRRLRRTSWPARQVLPAITLAGLGLAGVLGAIYPLGGGRGLPAAPGWVVQTLCVVALAAAAVAASSAGGDADPNPDESPGR